MTTKRRRRRPIVARATEYVSDTITRALLYTVGLVLVCAALRWAADRIAAPILESREARASSLDELEIHRPARERWPEVRHAR